MENKYKSLNSHILGLIKEHGLSDEGCMALDVWLNNWLGHLKMIQDKKDAEVRDFLDDFTKTFKDFRKKI